MRYALAILLAAAGPHADGRWTFCVAESGRDIWITGVFPAAHEREKLEAQFAAQLRARGVVQPDAQCPEPLRDRAEAFNAQFTAAEFHRKLGDTLHPAAPPTARR